MAIWAPVITTLGVNLLFLAFFYGVSWQTMKEHSRAIRWLSEQFDAEKKTVAHEQSDQWSQINRQREDIGRIKGKLGLNGGN